MIKIENTEVHGFEAAIRGMRNPMNSWDKSDSRYEDDGSGKKIFRIGENDLKLMIRLSVSGPEHRKFMRFITVTADVTAPAVLVEGIRYLQGGHGRQFLFHHAQDSREGIYIG